MDRDLQQLNSIEELLAKVVSGQSLTVEEFEKIFRVLLLHDKEGYHYITFLAALHARGETTDELLGFIKTIRELVNDLKFSASPDRIIDPSGTGGGSFKTINVSTAASFILAAAGYTVVKAAYHGVTSPTGSADVFSAFGIKLPSLTRETVMTTANEYGICPYFLPHIAPKLENAGQLAQKLFQDRQVRIRSILNLASGAVSPFQTTHRIYGCYSERYLEPLANMFKRLGFKRSLAVHGSIGIPEMSNVGPTVIVEQNGSDLRKYTVEPKDLNVRKALPDEIRSGGKEQNIIDFLRVIKNAEEGAKADLVIINAAAALYSLEDTSSIAEAVPKAREILQSGAAYDLLRKLVERLGSLRELERWESKMV